MSGFHGYLDEMAKLEVGNSSCPVFTSSDVLAQSTVAAESVAASFALLFYFLVLLITGVSVTERCRKLLSLETTSIFFLVGAIMVSVNIFTNENDIEIKMYYRIATGSGIGIVYMLIGALVFFERPRGCTTECRPLHRQPCTTHPRPPMTLATQQPSMGLVVSGITAPLLIIELFLVLGTQTKTGQESQSYLKFLGIIIADKSIYLIQKFIQVTVYVFIRNRTIRQHYVENAQFFFKVLAFFNVAEWLDSLVNFDSDLQLSKAQQVYGAPFEIISTLYQALVIDYRLLCALLFLEHALEANNEHPDPPQENEVYVDTSLTPAENIGPEIVIVTMTAEERQNRTVGYVLGSLCIFAQFLCLGGYLAALNVGAWIHVFSPVVDLFLIVCGVLLFRFNDIKAQGKKHYAGMITMVCCLGAIGLTDYIMKATLSGFWSLNEATLQQKPYFGWISYARSKRQAWQCFSKQGLRCILGSACTFSCAS
ncbi:uncharacterized protein LOC116613011 isoform X2 [Nematostella vectensis]|uniref:uncharacterized protein LOC116613011 isoform X2 n=1 Tax=Nematostella vectensis TaxID=45351 RepID=UPI00138FA5F2|nr:uncharacterized protein LOC116613011 isoform X2 [Nematostella vectensis]